MTPNETNELYKKYLVEVKGVGLEGDAMVYKVKFTRLGFKYEAEVGNVKNKDEAIKKVKEYCGDNIKIIKAKLFNEWQKIKIN